MMQHNYSKWQWWKWPSENNEGAADWPETAKKDEWAESESAEWTESEKDRQWHWPRPWHENHKDDESQWQWHWAAWPASSENGVWLNGRRR